MTLWFDVDDLFHYVQHNQRLSGVQRLTFEIYRAAEMIAPDEFATQTGYVRVDPATGRFAVVPWNDVLALWTRLTTALPTDQPPQVSPLAPDPPPLPFTRRAGSSITEMLPATARPYFQRFCMLQMGALRALRTLLRELTKRRSAARTHPEMTRPSLTEPMDDVLPFWATSWLDRSADPGDWLLSFGASWNRSDYGERVDHLRANCPIRLALLVYDLIPLRRPEWCHHTLVRDFDRWLREVLPRAEALFAISRATKADLSAFLRDAGIAPRHPIGLLPVGGGFSDARRRSTSMTQVPEPFVMFVSTIEPRKNHQLLVQVWRWLLEQRPARDVPTLVFAGRIGWMVEDLIEQLANTHYLGGKVMIVQDLSDELLRNLYDRCLFTVFPSQFEGWGLPITESFAHGKPCLASNTTSVPEAGGKLARYFDPDDFSGTCAAFTNILGDPEGLLAWADTVRRDFVPVPWSNSVRSVLSDLASRDADVAGTPTE